VATEAIDHAVERLERQRLARVAAPLEHERRGHLGDELVEEMPHERALAHAGAAVNEERARAPLARCPGGVVEPNQLRGATDEGALPRREGGTRSDGLPAGEARADFRAGGALFGLAAQERHAERLEIGGDVRPEEARRDRVAGPLGDEHLEELPLEGELPRQRDVQHHADGVPVGGLAERRTGGLLGRHVERRADDVGVVRVAARIPREFVHEPEIEQHHAPLGRDEHVLRLEIAVQLPRRVERGHPFGQLGERRADPVGIAPGRRAAGLDDDRLGLADERLEAPRRRAIDRDRPRRRVDARGRGPPREHPLEERRPVHALHREEPVAALAEQLVELHEVGVRDVGEGAELLLEAVDGRRMQAMETLQRDGGAALVVPRLEDLAEGALAEPPPDREALRCCDLPDDPSDPTPHSFPLPRARHASD
jgi:hypothetical protein